MSILVEGGEFTLVNRLKVHLTKKIKKRRNRKMIYSYVGICIESNEKKEDPITVGVALGINLE